MESSSDQNSGENDNDPPPPTSQGVETDTEKNYPLQSSESLVSNKVINEMEPIENNAATGSEVLPLGGSEENNVITSEQGLNKLAKMSKEKLMDISRKFALVFSYAARDRPRQPFMNQGNQGQPPPGYYPMQNRRGQSQRGQPQREQPQREQPYREQPQRERISREQPRREQTTEEHREQTEQPGHFNLQIANLYPWSPFIGLSRGFQWATYPNKISDSVPGSLALLVDTEVLFIIQQLNFFELLTSIPEPNLYLVLNKHGECLYYVYETYGCLEHCFCGSSRGFQLHVIDMYDNEVIFMNRPCGSTYMFCCYPAMEIYSPPMVPIGAVTKRRGCCKETFDIVDADQNIIFKIYGGSTCKFLCGVSSMDITIHALDPQNTVVGLIRREFISYWDYYADVDYYGVAFPKDMDVRLKAVFLGAAFLFDFMYFE